MDRWIDGSAHEFGLVDSNKDDVISLSGFGGAYGPESGAEFDRVDTNHDGSLSKAGYMAKYGEDGRPTTEESGAAREFGLVDSNKDDGISLTY